MITIILNSIKPIHHRSLLKGEHIMYLIAKKSISLLLISLILLMGCSHTAKVKKPTDSNDKAEWAEYYKDQFKANGKKVTVPADDASEVEKTAYKEARASFVRGQIIGWIGAGIALGLGVGLLAMTLSQASELE